MSTSRRTFIAAAATPAVAAVPNAGASARRELPIPKLVHHVFFWLKNPSRRKTWRACSQVCARSRRSRRCAARISACRPAPRNATSWTTATARRKSCSSTTPPVRRSTRITPSTRNSSPTVPICGNEWSFTTRLGLTRDGGALSSMSRCTLLERIRDEKGALQEARAMQLVQRFGVEIGEFLAD